MSAGSCIIPGNPDIAGIGVRIAIYVQNLLCFLPAFWALFDGKVTQSELDAAETQATTNLVLAFAILISSIVQAQTLGLTNYHASIILNMSWMNNTNAFIYFLLYIQHKSQLGIPGRVEPTWRDWVYHIRELAIAIVWHPGAAKSSPAGVGPDPELGEADGIDIASSRSGVERTWKANHVNVEGNYDFGRSGAKLLVKRFVLFLGSIHLSLMAGLGLWLWSNIRAFGEGQDVANNCAANHAFLAILGKHVPFASEALRVVSLVIYAVFLVPGVNLLLPVVVFLVFYHLHRVAPTPRFAGSGTTIDSHIRPSRLRFWIRRTYNSIVHRWGIFPPFIGLVFLLAINLVFIIDIEVALRQNAGLQGKDVVEAEWGFGQILAMLLLFMPLRDLAETFLARSMKQRQKDLDMGLGGAVKGSDLDLVRTWIARGANPNTKHAGMSAMRMSCKLEDLKIIRFLLEAGADPNIEGGDRRDPYTIERRNKDSLRLLNQVEKGSLDPAKALVQAAKNGYGAAIKIILSFLEINLDEKEKFLEAFSGININAGNTDWMASPAVAVTKAQEFETAILKLLASPGIDVNAPCTSGETPLSFAAGRGHEGVVKLLLAAPGINVNAPDAQGPLTFERSCQARYQVVNGYEVDMFKPGFTSYVDRPDAQGQTPLILAAQGGHEANVKLLLAAPGINVSVAPLSIAARGGHEAVVKLLLAMPGIDVNGPDKKGRTPLSFAAENGHEGVFKLLLAVPGINVHTSDVEGRTPLSFAARGGPGPGGWRVRPHNTPDRDWDEWIPLILEATDGHEAIVKHLLAVPEIPVNAPARDGWTPLMFAAKQGNEAIVKLLLAAPGIDINATDTSGWSASIWAAFQGNTAVVEALCVVPELIVDVADVKRRLKNPPKGWRWSCRNPGPEDDLRQEKCVRILENFVESKGGGAQDGAEKPGGG